MRWIKDYQLFLFDFDGLLVNTEETHYMAYKMSCDLRGVNLTWDFPRYCQAAHYEATAVRDQLYEEFPLLYEREPNWGAIYADKQRIILELIEKGSVQLMPGAYHLLVKLEEAQIPRCVVTHSPDRLISVLRKQHPILNAIPHWITREQYKKPKPDPECYQTAIDKFAKPQDNIIGFEDSPRGLTALLGTRAQAVLISQIPYPEISSFLQRGVLHYPSLSALSE